MSISPHQTIKGAAENIGRNLATSIATVVVMALILTTFHGLLVLYTKASATLASLENTFSITVYLKDDSEAFDVGKLVKELEKRSDITPPVRYTSREEAWKIMSERFGLESDLLKRYSFSLPASLTIQPRTPKDTPAIEAFISNNAKKIVRSGAFSDGAAKNLTDRMITFTENIKASTIQTLLLFLVFFVIGGSLLMSSTIHLALSSRHKEIAIMKLVGASRGRIVLPFVLEGVLLATLSYVIHLIAVVSAVPFTPGYERLHLNALVFEGATLVLLGGGVSYLTTLWLLKK